MKKIIFLILIIFISVVTLKRFFYPDFSKIKTELTSKEYVYKTKENWKITYKTDVEFDKQNKIVFPRTEVAKIKLYTGYFNFSKELNSIDSKEVVKILNDSSSYEWGEIGTFEPNKHLIFYDSNENIIGITEIDWAMRQTYSAPMNRTMKWGFLTYNGRDNFFEILEKY
ncbi:hypothetical protein [Flavobacterium aquicola]|uniref:Uncharacterized protein n=1 Tax=Flavobacterium aquicola TaxID=1682742 RepID=A0A3E0ER95_9FLAO|nr:hypothetical protein [Flavobacterium aquicola]REH00765.1 hypothetical protein C8P67_1029 [Flavobacterium aquicola]